MASILIVLHLFLPAATPEPIYAIRPDKSFSHSVEITGPQDRQYYEINIDGPRFYGTIELEGKRTPDASRRVVYDWYKITSPASLQLKSLYYGTRCRLDGHEYIIDAPGYLLSPAMLLAGDKVESNDDKGNVMIALRLKTPPGQNISEQQADKPPLHYLCVPVAQRHHHEVFVPRHQGTLYVIRESEAAPAQGTLGLVDQFGLHQVKRLRHAYEIVPINRPKALTEHRPGSGS